MKKINFIDLNKDDLINYLTQGSPALTGFLVRVGVKNLIDSYENNDKNELLGQQPQEESTGPKPKILIVRIIASDKKYKRARVGYAVYPPEILKKLEFFKNVKIKFNFASRPI